MNARSERVAAALGDRPLDLLIENVQLLNVYTQEIYPADIGVSGGVIVFAGPGAWDGPAPAATYDGEGRVATPGLIDTHLHIESSMIGPESFAAAVLPHGTTTVLIDPHEIANVVGLRGVEYMLEASEGLPLRVLVQAPSCVPAVPALETAGADFGAEEIATMLGWDRVVGLAEVMDYIGVIRQQDRMRDILAVSLDRDVVISGHSPLVRGRELAAYLVAGPDSDHESRLRDEMLEKLRLGMYVEGRVASHGESVSKIASVIDEIGCVPPNLIMCTDDVVPEDLLDLGHMDRLVRTCVVAGIEPVGAVRAATLHGAQRLRRRDLGALAPGKVADILLVDDLIAFDVSDVFVGGELVARDGHLVREIPIAPPGDAVCDTVHLRKALTLGDFELRSPGSAPTVGVHALDVGDRGRRTLATLDLPVTDGRLDISEDESLCLVAVLERHGRTGTASLNVVRGAGVTAGAAASTISHDSHNLIVVGRSPVDMLAAAQAVVDAGGGVASALDSEVTAVLSLPIAGLMSPEPVPVIVPKLKALNAALRVLGITREQPVIAIIGIALPVIPDYGVTDLGLVDVNAQQVISMWVGEGDG